MIDLILIIMLIISISKPDILLSKKVREIANVEQKDVLAKNIRKSWGILIALLETSALTRYVNGDIQILLFILIIVELVLLFVFSIPAIKENRRILKEIKLK